MASSKAIAIMDHWNDGEVQKEIIRNQYDFVIVQQGPSSQQNGRGNSN